MYHEKESVLPSNDHEILYRRLQAITGEATAALAGNDFEKLPDILAAHREAMARLQNAGDCRNPELLPLIRGIRDEARLVEQEIEKRLVEIREKLKVATTRRKISNAYGS
jgi:hypothetical protein